MLNYEKLFKFIKASPTAYHTVMTVRSALDAAGFTELYEGDAWQLKAGRGYYVIRGGSSIIAFVARAASGFTIVASHSDSPAFRIKETAETVGAYSRIEVEKYGGMIYHTWMDRPLGVAGRVLLRSGTGVKSVLVDLDKDAAVMPSLAIHLNRGVNDGAKLNPAVDLLPLYSLDKDKGALLSEVADKLGVETGDIISHDLSLYVRDEGRAFGKDGEFILAPRIDDLGCVFTSLEAFLTAGEGGSIPVLAVFDNEEVGSATKQGAESTFLYDTLMRLAGGAEAYRRALASSFMVSADNAHAIHPAHPEMSDPDHAPRLAGGVVIKHNSSQRYATDGFSDAVFRIISERASVPVQHYSNRADLPGGSTLGSISDTRVSIPTVDIGLPQLSMHSANETAAAIDLDYMIAVLRELYRASFKSVSGELHF